MTLGDPQETVTQNNRISFEFGKKLTNIAPNSTLEVVIAVKPADDLNSKLSLASLAERMRIYDENYRQQLSILMEYLAERGVKAKPLGNCPWFVAATLTCHQIKELDELQDSPIAQIVPGGILKFEYDF